MDPATPPPPANEQIDEKIRRHTEDCKTNTFERVKETLLEKVNKETSKSEDRIFGREVATLERYFRNGNVIIIVIFVLTSNAIGYFYSKSALERHISQVESRVITALERVKNQSTTQLRDHSITNQSTTKSSTNGEADQKAKSDYDSINNIVAQLIVVLFAGLIGFMGMKRLHLYDDEINRIRSTIDARTDSIRKDTNEQLAEIRKYVERTQHDINSQIDRDISESLSLINKISAQIDIKIFEIKKFTDDINERSNQSINESRSAIHSLSEKICKEINEQIGLIRQHTDSAKKEINEQIANFRVTIESRTESTRKEINAQIGDIRKHTELTKTDINAQIINFSATIESRTDSIRNEINAQIGDIRKYTELTKTDINAQIINFSATIDSRTDSIRKDTNDQIEQIRSAVDSIRKEAEEKIEQAKNNIGLIAESKVNEKFSDAIDDIKTKTDEGKKAFEAVAENLNRYDFLRDLSKAEDITETAEGLGSLENVHEVISRLFTEAREIDTKLRGNDDPDLKARRDRRTREALKIVDLAIENDIPGDADDYFNTATELAKRNYPSLAIQILEKGIKRFPDSSDLISAAIQYSVGNGDIPAATKYVERIEMNNAIVWNWRAFTFVTKYYGVVNDEAGARETYEKAWTAMPLDERPAVQFAELFERRSRPAEAIKILEEVMARPGIQAPQAASRLAKLYKDQGRYNEAIDMGYRALTMDTKDQSTVNLGAVHLDIALAMEARWQEKVGKVATGDRGTSVVNELIGEVRDILSHYAAAMKSDDRLPNVPIAVELRLNTIRAALSRLGLAPEQIATLFDKTGLGDSGNQVEAMKILQQFAQMAAREKDKDESDEE